MSNAKSIRSKGPRLKSKTKTTPTPVFYVKTDERVGKEQQRRKPLSTFVSTAGGRRRSTGHHLVESDFNDKHGFALSNVCIFPVRPEHGGAYSGALWGNDLVTYRFQTFVYDARRVSYSPF